MSEPETPVLEVRGLTKTFPGVVALAGVDLTVHAGEVHVVVGENGAGKSTLIKVITGAYAPTEGEVLVDGVRREFATPSDAQAAGIRPIYQEVGSIPLMTVAENLFLRRQPLGRTRLIDRDTMNREAQGQLADLGIDVDVTRPLGEYSVAAQQMVAVARAVSQTARMVIMDEPTASLEPREVETLFDVIARLKSSGVGVIYVSHRLDELYAIGDRVTVLRDGVRVHSGDLSALPKRELVNAMLGRELTKVATEQRAAHVSSSSASGREVVLEASGLTSAGDIEDVSITTHEAEVVGLAGLLGAGRSETLRAVHGSLPTATGEVRVAGEVVATRSPKAAVRAGIAFLPEDRKADGIVPNLSVRDNIVLAALPTLSRRGVVSRAARDRLVDTFAARLNIKMANLDQPVAELSGGNQQKVLLARLLCSEPKVLLLDEPTRGIDVGAKAEIRHLIDELAHQGLSVVLVSSELSEIVGGSDRVLVLKDGRIVGELAAAAASEDAVTALIAGQHDDDVVTK